MTFILFYLRVQIKVSSILLFNFLPVLWEQQSGLKTAHSTFHLFTFFTSEWYEVRNQITRRFILPFSLVWSEVRQVIYLTVLPFYLELLWGRKSSPKQAPFFFTSLHWCCGFRSRFMPQDESFYLFTILRFAYGGLRSR